MFKNRYFLIGLGSGLIVGALLLQLMNAAVQPVQSPYTEGVNPKEMDPASLKEAAKSYYQVFDKQEKVYTQDQVKEELNKQLEGKTAQKEEKGSGKQGYLYVASNMDSKTVSDLLEKMGFVQDSKELQQELNNRNLQTKIQTGLHHFEGEPSLDEIITNLTTLP